MTLYTVYESRQMPQLAESKKNKADLRAKAKTNFEKFLTTQWLTLPMENYKKI